MTDSNDVSMVEVACRLQVIATDLRAIEARLPAPLSLSSALREVTATADACTRLAETAAGTEPRTETCQGDPDE